MWIDMTTNDLKWKRFFDDSNASFFLVLLLRLPLLFLFLSSFFLGPLSAVLDAGFFESLFTPLPTPPPLPTDLCPTKTR